MPTLSDIQTYFTSWYSFLMKFWQLLTYRGVGEYLLEVAEGLSFENGLASAVVSALGYIVNLGFGEDSSLLTILIGGSLTFFVAFTLIKWVIDVLP